ncbi:MAG: GNAT family N-acetyltransferase [bacterium]|nr:GNAT family N-acetyltransferase [bacterium]
MVTFRQVDHPFRPTSAIWHVEYFDDGPRQQAFPVGTAYVVAAPPPKEDAAQVNYILVGDAWRRQGIARKLVDACRERWPRLLYTSPMSDEGRAFVETMWEPYEEDDDGESVW